MMRRGLAAVALTLGLGVAACDSGPSGPGTLLLTVSGSPPAGVVLVEVTGQGIRSFEGQGPTEAFSAPVAPTEGRYRVVALSPSGGELHVGIRVEDVGSDLPAVAVLSAASPSNQPMLATGLIARIER